MKAKVFGYVRVSTENQAREGYSIAFQQDEIRRYCEQNNLELLEIFKDEGISGAKIDEDGLTVDRPALQEMLAELQIKAVKYIVCLNTSRLWRSDTAKILIQRVLKKHGVDIKAVEQPTYSVYANDPTNVLVNGLMELLDEYQRLEIALKLSKGRKRKAKEGKYSGGGIAYGYRSRKSEKNIEVDEKRARGVKRVFEIREQYPGYSLAQIALKINSEGHRTARCKEFTKVQVKRILDHESFYRGQYKYAGIQAEGRHTAII